MSTSCMSASALRSPSPSDQYCRTRVTVFRSCFENAFTYFSEERFILSLKIASWNCWDKNAIKAFTVLPCIKNLFAFLFFICIPTPRSLVAVSLFFFHTCPVLVSSHYTKFSQFLWSSVLAVCYPYQVMVWWPIPTVFSAREFIFISTFYFDILGHISCIWLVLIIVMGLNLWLESHLGLNFQMSESGLCS